MSQKQFKRLRRLEEQQAAQEEALRAIEDKRQEVRQEALDKAFQDRREARRRAAEAERAKAVWKAVALGAIAAEVITIAAVWPRAASPAAGAVINRPPVTVEAPALEAADRPEYHREARRFPWAQELGPCTVTWYTADDCNKTPDHPAYGITASGAPVRAGWTCAVDPVVIPLGSTVLVERADGTMESYHAADTGVQGRAVDIYIPDRAAALQNGRQTLTVWFLPPAGEVETCT